MKYISQIEINKPLDEVIELFDNPDNLYKWMEGLKSFETISGVQGQPGAKSLLKFEMGKRKFQMIETIIIRNLPAEFSGTYESDGMFNKVKIEFKELDAQKTLYMTHQEFIFSGLMMRLVAFLFPFAFKKQTMKFLMAFKKFAESA